MTINGENGPLGKDAGQNFLCYVINLEGSTQRLEDIAQNLGAAGIRFKRLSAFDGRKQVLSSFRDYDPEAARRYMGRELVGGEIGCYYSHLNAARKFLETGQSHCLVVEDDALPDRNLLKIVNETIAFLDGNAAGWRIVNLGNHKTKIFRKRHQIHCGDRTFTLCDAFYFPMTTAAILWSRKGASDFVESHTKIFAPVDNFFRHWITRVGGGFSFLPRPVSTTDAESDIAHAGKSSRSHNQRSFAYGIRKQRRLILDKIIAITRKYL